jgi:7,8-dihydropterin-6-yl-methyl-4-(beta-D-ribofuranosyl)aminobenzene 5'-phosphate synthase
MIDRLRVTVLADNSVTTAGLLAEHGLSILIETHDRRILFDTGQGKVLCANAKALSIRLSPLDAVVLSHGHYDHTGGLEDLLQETRPSAIYFHPAALQRKYAKSDSSPHRSIGIPDGSREALDVVRDRVVQTRKAVEVVPGVWCTGEIPRLPGNGQSEAAFFLGADCREPDPIADDQALFIETVNGLVVIAGCAHAGVRNTLDRIAELSGRSEIHALIGGLHLGHSTREELEASANAIGRRNCRILAPCHCTGMRAHAYLRGRFGSLVQDVGVGTELLL